MPFTFNQICDFIIQSSIFHSNICPYRRSNLGLLPPQSSSLSAVLFSCHTHKTKASVTHNYGLESLWIPNLKKTTMTIAPLLCSYICHLVSSIGIIGSWGDTSIVIWLMDILKNISVVWDGIGFKSIIILPSLFSFCFSSID